METPSHDQKTLIRKNIFPEKIIWGWGRAAQRPKLNNLYYMKFHLKHERTWFIHSFANLLTIFTAVPTMCQKVKR